MNTDRKLHAQVRPVNTDPIDRLSPAELDALVDAMAAPRRLRSRTPLTLDSDSLSLAFEVVRTGLEAYPDHSKAAA